MGNVGFKCNGMHLLFDNELKVRCFERFFEVIVVNFLKLVMEEYGIWVALLCLVKNAENYEAVLLMIRRTLRY